jgi:hypothetical protein
MRTLLAVALALAAGCDDDNTMMMTNPDLSASSFPAAPAIGSTQLDRMGRAAINTALTDPFFTDKTMHEGKQDAYNKAAPQAWQGFAAQFAPALAVFDGLDGVCGNQPLSSADASDGGASAGYGTLASILANDVLLLDTAVNDCSAASNYLAVEVSVITSGTPASCGGRTPLDNVIDVTYTVLSGGAQPVTNGVTKDADANAAQLANFPFLGAPQ